MRQRLLFSIFFNLLAVFMLTAAPILAANLKFPKLNYVSGGNAKFPYSLQPGDQGNTYFETFFKASLPIWKVHKSKVTFFIRGFYSKDSLELTFNNRSKVSVGFAYTVKLRKTFSVSASIKYDRDFGLLKGNKKSGFRGNFSYFYYKSWWRNMPGDHKRWFRQKTWTRVWGVFTFPESLDGGNRNLAFITGLEAAAAFVRPKGKLQYAPFAELTLALDSKKYPSTIKLSPPLALNFVAPLKAVNLIRA